MAFSVKSAKIIASMQFMKMLWELTGVKRDNQLERKLGIGKYKIVPDTLVGKMSKPDNPNHSCKRHRIGKTPISAGSMKRYLKLCKQYAPAMYHENTPENEFYRLLRTLESHSDWVKQITILGGTTQRLMMALVPICEADNGDIVSTIEKYVPLLPADEILSALLCAESWLRFNKQVSQEDELFEAVLAYALIVSSMQLVSDELHRFFVQHVFHCKVLSPTTKMVQLTFLDQREYDSLMLDVKFNVRIAIFEAYELLIPEHKATTRRRFAFRICMADLTNLLDDLYFFEGGQKAKFENKGRSFGYVFGSLQIAFMPLLTFGNHKHKKINPIFLAKQLVKL